MIVPARYKLENKLNNNGRCWMTPRKIMTAKKVARNATMRMIPNRQDTFSSLSLGMALAVDLSREPLEIETVGSILEFALSICGVSGPMEVSRADTPSVLFVPSQCQLDQRIE